MIYYFNKTKDGYFTADGQQPQFTEACGTVQFTDCTKEALEAIISSALANLELTEYTDTREQAIQFGSPWAAHFNGATKELRSRRA